MTEETKSLPDAGNEIKCMSCGYSIVGLRLGERCPECGTQVLQFASQSSQSSGKAITSMVLGIVSILTCFGYGILGLPCGIIAVIFAKKARLAIQAGTAPASSQGMATAGKVCGWIGIVLSSLMLAYLLFVIFVLVLGLGAAAAGGGAGP
jgi:predicted RNA-binding Zn-ribbon protein involved in translation (DUF1610 family)